MKNILKISFCTLLICLITACGGGGGGSGGSSPTFTVSATVSGLNGGRLVLQDNGGDDLVITSNGIATFTTPIAQNGSYAVSIKSEPEGQACTVGNETGTGVVANVSNVTVACSALSYTVSGIVNGLSDGQVLVLTNTTESDSVTITGSSSASVGFTFPSQIAYLSGYNVEIQNQPANQTCSISNNSGSGAGVTDDVTSVEIVCSTNAFSVGGTVAGLLEGQQVTLYNNGGDAVTIAYPNTHFSFSDQVAFGGSYTVTVNQQPTSGVCTVSNDTGTVTDTISDIAVTCSPQAFTVGGSVSGLTSSSVTLFNNSSDATTITSPKTQFEFNTPIAYLSNYSVTVSSNPLGQTCTVANSSGTITSNVNNVLVNCASSTYAYVTNQGGKTISTYLVSGTGLLTPIGTPVPTQSNPNAIAASPSGKALYVVSYSGAGVGKLESFAIGSDGLLTSLGSPVDTGPNPNAIALNSAGTLAYVTNWDNDTVSGYQINQSNNKPSPLATPTFSTGRNPNDVAITPDDKFVYVSNFSGNSVTVFALNNSTGNLAQQGDPMAVASPTDMAISSDGKKAFVTSKGQNKVYEYPILANGTWQAGKVVTVGSEPAAIVANPAATVLYVANGGDGTISTVSVAADGTMSVVGSPTSSPTSPRGIALGLDGGMAYIANYGSNMVSMYSVTPATGVLKPFTPATVATGTSPFGIVIVAK